MKNLYVGNLPHSTTESELRTVFEASQGRPIQVIHENSPLSLEILDLQDLLNRPETVPATRLLATLIVNDIAEVRIAFADNPGGICKDAQEVIKQWIANGARRD